MPNCLVGPSQIAFRLCSLLYYCNVNRDTTVKGLIITGQGKHFSLGLDVDFLGNQTEEYMEDFRAKNAKLYWRLFVFPIPTVAVMNGKLSCNFSWSYSKTCLKRPLRTDKTKVLKTNGSLMKVESIAECSMSAFCNTFDMH